MTMFKNKMLVKFKNEPQKYVIRGMTDKVAALYDPLGVFKPVMLIFKGAK